MAKNGRQNRQRSHENRSERKTEAESQSPESEGLSRGDLKDIDPDERTMQIEQNRTPVFGPERPSAEETSASGTASPMPNSNGMQRLVKEATRPSQDHHDYTLEERLENELQYYKVELETEYNKRWEAEQLELRRLRKVEQDFQKLQAKELQAIDRFQGMFDSDFIKALGVIDSKMKTLVAFLSKCSCKLKGPKLSAKLKPYIWLSPYDRKEDHLDVNNKALHKKLLESMIWKFLQRQLFSRPFLCFGDKNGELADELFSNLYDEFHGHPESVKWRTFTVERLKALEPNGGHEETHNRLLAELQQVLKDLKYEVEVADLRKKSEPLFNEAIQLAKHFAAQRAIYQFFDPGRAEKSWTQCLRSEYCENKKDEGDEGPDEGNIAFIVVPALLRYGTVMGEGLKEQPLLLSKAFVHLK